jgi:hypothetical protein
MAKSRGEEAGLRAVLIRTKATFRTRSLTFIFLLWGWWYSTSPRASGAVVKSWKKFWPHFIHLHVEAHFMTCISYYVCYIPPLKIP